MYFDGRDNFDVFSQKITFFSGTDDKQPFELQIGHGDMHRPGFSRCVIPFDFNSVPFAVDNKKQVEFGDAVHRPEKNRRRIESPYGFLKSEISNVNFEFS
jgi:hypothetical protein